MRRDLIPYPEFPICDPYENIQKRICEETKIMGGVVVYTEILVLDHQHKPIDRQAVIEGFRKTSYIHGRQVRIPTVSERLVLSPSLLERLNENPISPSVSHMSYAHPVPAII